MAKEPDPQFAEDEDMERARAFWKENGRSIIAGVVLGVGAIGGWNGWQIWQKSQGENASTLYENLRSDDIELSAAASLADDLMEDYSATPYAIHGALMMAKKSMQNDDIDEARRYLEWALENARDEGLKNVSRLRLAQVMLEAGGAQDALETLAGGADAAQSGPFAARYQELSGDAEALLGNNDAALAAWQKSRDLLAAGDPMDRLLGLKIDNLGQL
jgi:predicted negative regulator of RcsB-dependent stress response